MAAFTRQRGPGLWVNNDVVTSAEFDEIDAIRPKLINAADGSSHAPSTQIVLGGSGLSVTGPSSWANTTLLTMNAAGTAAFGTSTVTAGAGTWTFTNTTVTFSTLGTVNLNGTTKFKNLQSASGGSAFLMDTDCVGTIQSNAFIGLSGTAHIDLNTGTKILVKSGAQIEVQSGGNVNVDGDITTSGTATVTLGGNLAINDNTKTFTSVRKLSFASSTVGSLVYRTATLSDASQTIDVAKDYYILVRVAAAARTLTLRHSTSPIPSTGQTITVSRRRPGVSSNVVGFEREDGTVLASFLADSGGTTTLVQHVRFIYIPAAGGWIVDDAQGKDVTVLGLSGTYA